MNPPLSARRRDDILNALRRGTVPQEGLGALAVGLDRFKVTVREDLERVAAGGGAFKAIRGEYGCGKTFFSRWLQEQARGLGQRPCANSGGLGVQSPRAGSQG